MLAGQDFVECAGEKTCEHCRRDLRKQCERHVRVRGVRCWHTMIHDLGRGHGLRLCGTNTTAETGRRAVPCCLGFNCEKKCQQTEAEGKRSAPIRRGSGEPSRHNASLSRGHDREVTAAISMLISSGAMSVLWTRQLWTLRIIPPGLLLGEPDGISRPLSCGRYRCASRSDSHQGYKIFDFTSQRSLNASSTLRTPFACADR